jgi:integrase/recombinase XerD
MVQRYADRADINKTISPHSFRHFAVTEATRSGSQAVEIQSLTGHAYVDTVAQYTHLNQVETVEEIQKRRGYEY